MSGETWRVLEFYSGIGGMRYSLIAAGVVAEVVEAFDINDRANDVYEANFNHRPCQGNIQTLTSADLDKYDAHAWLLSPPCQPYTRQGLQKDSADARASSFMKTIKLMQHMNQPPLFLFVENVVGFEVSDTHDQLVEALNNLDFVIQEFILSPLQFGIPYSRPRYFCLAKRKPLCFLNSSINKLCWIPPSATAEFASQDEIMNNSGNEEAEKSRQGRVEDFLDEKIEENLLPHYRVPPSLIERWGNAMDVVHPESTRCCCFTKSYYRYVKGTGSFLATDGNSGLKADETTEVQLKELGLRYFTPREVANLHSFPLDFRFPAHISLRQQYALLGNSLSVAVVAPLLSYLFAEPR